MAIVRKIEHLSIPDYLILEERGEERHEYVNGTIFAMVGGTARHNLISTTITSLLRSHLRGTLCNVFMSDMKLHIDDVFYYPDVMVVCGSIKQESLYQTDPVLVVEVLSKSTESKDRLEKLVAYQSIQSVKEYVLVSQDKVAIDIFRRNSDSSDSDEWEMESLRDGDTIKLTSVQYRCDAESWYSDVLKT